MVHPSSVTFERDGRTQVIITCGRQSVNEPLSTKSCKSSEQDAADG